MPAPRENDLGARAHRNIQGNKPRAVACIGTAKAVFASDSADIIDRAAKHSENTAYLNTVGYTSSSADNFRIGRDRKYRGISTDNAGSIARIVACRVRSIICR